MALVVVMANVHSHAIVRVRGMSWRGQRIPIDGQSEVFRVMAGALSEIRKGQNVSNTGTQSMVDGSPRAQTRNHLKSNHERQTLARTYQWIIRSNAGSRALTQYNNTDSIFGECVRTLTGGRAIAGSRAHETVCLKNCYFTWTREQSCRFGTDVFTYNLYQNSERERSKTFVPMAYLEPCGAT